MWRFASANKIENNESGFERSPFKPCFYTKENLIKLHLLQYYFVKYEVVEASIKHIFSV